MLYGYIDPNAMLNELKISDIPFHLTGSRFFGVNTPESDWDFFTDYNEETEKFLREKGFHEIRNSTRYSDSETVTVYRWHDTANNQIDIQLVRDIALKNQIQNILKNMGYTNPTTAMWNLAFKVAYCVTH